MVESLGAPDAVPNRIKELTEHFGGADPEQLPRSPTATARTCTSTFQYALEEFLEYEGRIYRVTGVHCPSATGDPGATSLALCSPMHRLRGACRLHAG